MITLSKKLRETRDKSNHALNSQETSAKHSFIRDRLLVKEIAELNTDVVGAEIIFPDPDKLYEFQVLVRPDEGMWKGGTFKFSVFVPEEYNIKPPQVKCVTKLWHPNISPEGAVCLSILREHSLDGSGWAPTRSVKDVVWGLTSIFMDRHCRPVPENCLVVAEFCLSMVKKLLKPH